MLDDGLGNDRVESDGVYTSPSFLAEIPAGVDSVVCRVLAQTASGGFAYRWVSVPVAFVASRFAEKSAEVDGPSGLSTVGGEPYSAVTVNFGTSISDTSDWGKEDLVVSQLDESLKVFGDHRFTGSPLPTFSQVPNGAAFVQGDEPNGTGGTRGMAVADFDNDGFEDFYVARDDVPRLYRWNASYGDGAFEDVADSHLFSDGPDSTSLANWGKASGAAWGDFDQDGWVDLILSRHIYDVPLPSGVSDTSGSGGAPGSGENTILYRNRGGRLYAAISDPIFATELSSFSVQWADIDDDGDLDLFLADLVADSAPATFVNSGYVAESTYPYNGSEDSYSLSVPVGSWFSDPPVQIVSSQFVDLNNDGFLDLVTAREASDDNLQVYLNDGIAAAPSFSLVPTSVSGTPAVSGPVHNVITGDFDLNGSMDIMTVPGQSDEAPWVLYNGLSSVPGQFAYGVNFEALQAGSFYGAVANDWNTDGDLDLYLARPADPVTGLAENFFYQAQSSVNFDLSGLSDPIPDVYYVKVRLVGNGATSNVSAIGAKVEVMAPERIGPAQWVSGGDGRGTQRARTLVFGLPASQAPAGGQVDVRVTWPDGYVQTTTCDLNSGSPQLIMDTRVAAIDPGSLYANKTLNQSTGALSWSFEFEANCQLTDFGVVFDPAPGGVSNPSACLCVTGGSSSAAVTLVDGAYGATVLKPVRRGPTTWRYKVSWPDRCCECPCTYAFSAFGEYLGQSLTAGPVTVKTFVCLSPFPGF